MAERQRLVGWKAIAAYLGKDVRTLLRWERERGLPVHRPPGRRGQSVYAFPEELDRWIQAPPPVMPPMHPQSAPEPRTSGHEPQTSAARARLARPWLVAGLLLTALVGSYAAWPRPPIARVAVQDGAIRAFDGKDRELWDHRIEGDSVTLSVENGVGRAAYIGDIDGDGAAEAVVSILVSKSSPNIVSGLLLCFEANGRLRWSREFDDVIAFDGRRFGAPWAVADLMVFGGDRKTIGIAAHHMTWWPAMVLTLDATTGATKARYTHRGWIMRADVTPDTGHIITAAMNNAHDAQAVAVLDSATLSERSYFLLPRPDASAAIAEPLDRQHYWISQVGPPTIRFGHSRALSPVPETIVELSPDLRRADATFSDSYWRWHRALERTGQLAHAADACPERGGPVTQPVLHHESQ